MLQSSKNVIMKMDLMFFFLIIDQMMNEIMMLTGMAPLCSRYGTIV